MNILGKVKKKYAGSILQIPRLLQISAGSRKNQSESFPLTPFPAFCTILGTSSLFGVDLNFMQSG